MMCLPLKATMLVELAALSLYISSSEEEAKGSSSG